MKEIMYKSTTTACVFNSKSSGCPGKEDILMQNPLRVLPKCHINLDSAATNIIKHYFHNNVLGSQHKRNKIHITSMYMCKSPKISRNCFFILAIKWGQKSQRWWITLAVISKPTPVQVSFTAQTSFPPTLCPFPFRLRVHDLLCGEEGIHSQCLRRA